MSAFLNQAKAYQKTFNVSSIDFMKVLVLYPVFKMHYLQNRYGKKFGVLDHLSNISVSQKMTSGTGKNFSLQFKLNNTEISNFREIFWSAEYKAALPYDQIETIVDLGANMGIASQYFATQCPLKKLVAVEANPQLIPALEKNILSVSDNTVIVHALVTGTETGEGDFIIHEDHRHSSSNELDGGTKTSVAKIPLREILDKEFPDQKVDLLKMDIEGGEYPLIEQDPEVLSRFKNFAFELHGDRSVRDDMVAKLESLSIKVIDRRLQDEHRCEVLFAQQM